MKKFLLFIPCIIFFIIIIIFFYFLVIDRDPSEIPSALINEKIPVFVTSSLFDKNNFVSSNEFGKEITYANLDYLIILKIF